MKFAPIASLFLVLAACSSSNDPAPITQPGDDAGTTRDASVSDSSPVTVEDSSTAADTSTESPDAADSATGAFATCTDTELQANPVFGNGADISFFDAGKDGGAYVYVNNCVRIPAGKSVGIYGDFTMEPLVNDGEPGTPIPNLSTGNDSGRITFPTAGKYSFHSANHPTTMYGTVEVD